MTGQYNRCLLLVVSAGLWVSLTAHSSVSPVESFISPAIHQFTTSDGLAQNTVHDISQSKSGFIILSTREGVQQFDGRAFTAIEYDGADNNKFSADRVWATIQDQQGFYWIATIQHGLKIYDPAADTSSVYNVAFQEKAVNTVTTIFDDSDETIWFGTDGSGLCRFDPHHFKVPECFLTPGKKGGVSPSNIIMDITDYQENYLLIATYGNGLYRFNLTDQTFSPVGRDGLYTMSVIYHEKQIWSGTKYNGLMRLSDVYNTPHFFRHEPDDPYSLAHDFIWPLLIDSDGDLWIGTFGGGLNFLQNPQSAKPESIEFQSITSGQTIPGEFPGSHVLSLYQDDNGLLWAGTDNNGFISVNKIPKSKVPESGNIQGLDTKIVTSLFRDNHKNTWIATPHDLIRATTNGSFSFTETHTYPISNVVQIIEDEEGLLWLASGSNGIAFYDQVDNDFKPVELTDATGTTPDRVYSLAQDRNGRYWMIGNRGVWSFTMQDQKVREVSRPQHTSLLKSGSRLHLSGDKLLVTGEPGDMYFIHIDEPSAVYSLADYLEAESFLPQGRVLAIDSGFNNTFWASTDQGGLYHIRFRDNRVYSRQYQLQNLPIRDIKVDENQHVWFITRNGLSIFKPESKLYRTLRIPHGFDNSSLTHIHRYDNFHYWISGNDGSRIFNTNITNRPSSRLLKITGLDVMNQSWPLPEGERGSKSTVKLDYDQNFFTVHFALMEYWGADQHRYRYKLEGIDLEWINSGNHNEAQYTAIPPGSYTFHVQATDYLDRPAINEASLHIVISPPLWGTWWFKSLIFLLAAGLGTLAYRFRVSTLLEVERTRQRIADDLHDDIGTKVSSAGLMLDVCSRKYQTLLNDSMFLKAKMLTREVANDVRDAIWLIDQSNDSWESLIFRMRQTASQLLIDTQVFWNINLPVYPELDMEKRRDLFLIFKETLHNIHKHSEAKQVHIELFIDGNRLTHLSIEDDGKGFDPEISKEGRGMNTLKRRAAKLNGKLEVTSRYDRGTRIHLWFAV